MNTGTVTIPTKGGAEGDNVIKFILALFPLVEQLPLSWSSAICLDAQVIPNMHLLNDKIKKNYQQTTESKNFLRLNVRGRVSD